MKKRLETMTLILVLVLAALPTGQVALAFDPVFTYTVINTSNAGVGSLRQAMLNANMDGGRSVIEFAIPEIDTGYNGLTGVWTISPTVALPPLTEDKTIINGYSQLGAAVGTMANPPTIVIEINGTEVENQNGFNIGSSGNTIRGLAINRFGWSGIAIGGTSTMSNTISGNYIGTDPSGTTCLGNTLDGVSILLGAHHNTIGGDSLADQNVIGGNGGDGVGIYGDNTTGNVVTANLIGTSRSLNDLGNASYGVNIYGGAHGNIIGVNALYQGNGICANDLGGIRIAGANTRDNVVSGSDIGVSTLGNGGTGVIITEGAHDNTVGSGNDVLNNGMYGVRISGASTMSNTVSGNAIHGNAYGVDISGAQSNNIGGGAAGERNAIYNNFGSGIAIYGGAQYNTVSGNYIGIDNGGSVRPNDMFGVNVNGADHNTIGPDNVISGNTDYGVGIADGQGNTILGNYIGTDAEGTLAPGFGNGMAGIWLAFSAIDNIVGGTVADAGNVIDGNGGDGINILGSGTMGNVVLGNVIGRETLGNGENGVLITNGAHDNTIGLGNSISGNGAGGVRIDDTDTMSNTISGNEIRGNAEDGVYIYEAQNNTVGGDTEGERNIILNNDRHGVYILVGQHNTISGNYIGVDADGNAVGNVGSGVILDLAQHNTIGGTTRGERNVISYNAVGIGLFESGNNTIRGNYIGTDASGIPAVGFGNRGDGISLDVEFTGNVIGGTAAGAGNVIAGNGGHGVHVVDDDAAGNPVIRNSIYANTGDGIHVSVSWTPAAPVIVSTDLGASIGIVGTACAGCTVEVFANSDDDGEGETFVGDDVADGSGAFTVTVSSLSKPYLTATATDVTNTTSEFSDAFEFAITQVYLPLVVRGN